MVYFMYAVAAVGAFLTAALFCYRSGDPLTAYAYLALTSVWFIAAAYYPS